jgi:hypothetical protein
VLIADERWTRLLSRSLTGELRGGVSAYRAVREDGIVEQVMLPVVGGSVTTQRSFFNRPLDLRLELNLVPHVDAYSGAVSHRIESVGGLSWKYQELMLVVRGSGSLAVTGWERRGQALATADAGAAYLFPSQGVQLEAGLRSAWQAGLGVVDPFQWGAYLAVGFTRAGAL